MAPPRGPGGSPLSGSSSLRKALFEKFGPDLAPPSGPLVFHIVARQARAGGEQQAENEGVAGDILAEVFISPTDNVLSLRRALAKAAGVAHLGGLFTPEGEAVPNHLGAEAAGLRNHSEVRCGVANELVVATCSSDCDVRIWDSEAGRCLDTLRAHEEPVHCVSLSRFGNILATGSSDRTARLWRTRDRECVGTLTGHTDWLTAAEFTPDEQTVVTASMDCMAKVWDVETAACTRTVAGTVFPVLAASISPSGALLAIAGSPTCMDAQLWDLRADSPVRAFQGGAAGRHPEGGGMPGHQDSVRSVSFAPSGQAVLTGSQDKEAKVWDVGGGHCAQTFAGHTDYVVSASFSPDARHVVTASFDRTVKVWEVENSECRRTLHGHTGAVTSAAVAPDGRLAVSGARDSTVRLWDIKTGRCVSVMEGHKSKVNAVAFVPF